MKIRTLAVTLAIALATVALGSQAARAEVSFDVFYSNLSPHGNWYVSAQYGRVWQPSVYRPGWNPYYDGHWAYSDLGWTWVSDYEWGATPYHYGTWVEDPDLGWAWVPGYTWAPAWVVFSSGPDYIGWAPVPVDYSFSVSLGPRDIGPSRFVFVPAGNFLAPRVRGYAVPPSRTTVIVNRTRIVNNITVQNNVVVNRGPDVAVVERACHRRVQAVPIERVQRAAPGPRFSRDEIRVDPRRSRDELRVAEPRSGRMPLPPDPHRAPREDRPETVRRLKMAEDNDARWDGRPARNAGRSEPPAVEPAGGRRTQWDTAPGNQPRTDQPKADQPRADQNAGDASASPQGRGRGNAQAAPQTPPGDRGQKQKGQKKERKSAPQNGEQDNRTPRQ